MDSAIHIFNNWGQEYSHLDDHIPPTYEMTPDFKLFNILGCVGALGVENGEIPDVHITASSQLDDNNGAALARLRLKKDGPKQGGWSALYNDFGQWIQVDLGGSTRVTRVATQGRNAHDAWVVKYRLQYGEDLGINFTFVKKSVNSSAKVCLFDYMEPFFYLL